jgi:hypothetical protein
MFSPNTECGGDESFLPDALLAGTSLPGSDPWGEEVRESQLSWVKNYPVISISQPKNPKKSHQLEFRDGRPELARIKGD